MIRAPFTLEDSYVVVSLARLVAIRLLLRKCWAFKVVKTNQICSIWSIEYLSIEILILSWILNFISLKRNIFLSKLCYLILYLSLCNSLLPSSKAFDVILFISSCVSWSLIQTYTWSAFNIICTEHPKTKKKKDLSKHINIHKHTHI